MSFEASSKVDVVVIFDTHEEQSGMNRVLDRDFHLTPQELRNQAGLPYFCVCIPRDGKSDLKIAMILPPTMQSIYNIVGQLSSFLKPKIFVSCELCLGIDGKTKMGDIVFANELVRFQFPRTTDVLFKYGDDERLKADFDWKPPATIKIPKTMFEMADRLLTIFLKQKGIDFTDKTLAGAFPQDMRRHILKYLREKKYLELKCLDLTPKGVERAQEIQSNFEDTPDTLPKIHVGTIVTSDTLFRDPNDIKQIEDIIPSVLATDTMSDGLSMNSRITKTPDPIVVKCVANMIDNPKDHDFERCAGELVSHFLIEYLCHHLD